MSTFKIGESLPTIAESEALMRPHVAHVAAYVKGFGFADEAEILGMLGVES